MGYRGGAVEDFLDGSIREEFEREEQAFACALLYGCCGALVAADLYLALEAINRIEVLCFRRMQPDVVFLLGQYFAQSSH